MLRQGLLMAMLRARAPRTCAVARRHCRPTELVLSYRIDHLHLSSLGALLPHGGHRCAFGATHADTAAYCSEGLDFRKCFENLLSKRHC